MCHLWLDRLGVGDPSEAEVDPCLQGNDRAPSRYAHMLCDLA